MKGTWGQLGPLSPHHSSSRTLACFAQWLLLPGGSEAGSKALSDGEGKTGVRMRSMGQGGAEGEGQKLQQVQWP